MPSPVNPQLQSPLFSLPYEIRLHIYTHLYTISSSPISLRCSPPSTPSSLSLLATCRRAAEAEHHLYELNTFEAPFDDPSHLAKFIATTPLTRRRWIHSVYIQVPSGGMMLGLLASLREGLPGLRQLTVRRRKNIHYVNLSDWTLLMANMVDELRGMKNLVQFEIAMPRPVMPLTDWEKLRKSKLQVIDDTLRAAARHNQTV
ncbi:hypothetical protein VHEMI08929 [[Torrubiella] hemipterigena]|uniref:F-box domain-containing protein n=1 Tax=[Torrubiella] hemipterigena TaxID=1531966 RepID=A0A0A1TP39_9HYPO|nr:hypothetical protein VHEMI08929 [[Torrubiella] hemipterigena]